MGEEKTLAANQHKAADNRRRFHSITGFFREFFRVARLNYKKRKSLRKMAPAFRETVCLAVTFANNCGP